MSAYLVPKHVHVCTTRDAAVLLDLRADRYIGLDREQTQALALLVQDWPGVSATGEIDTRDAEDFGDELMRQGLLTRDAACGKSARPVQLPSVEAKLVEWDSAQWPAIRAAHVGRFAMAYARGFASLRIFSLERTIRRVEQRKADRSCRHEIDLERARDLTGVFRALRPLFYSVVDQCLLDSLVLLEFLALHNVFPTWVFGVQATPFAAHSWVQIERYVLNGPPSYVRAFTPILAV